MAKQAVEHSSPTPSALAECPIYQRRMGRVCQIRRAVVICLTVMAKQIVEHSSPKTSALAECTYSPTKNVLSLPNQTSCGYSENVPRVKRHFGFVLGVPEKLVSKKGRLSLDTNNTCFRTVQGTTTAKVTILVSRGQINSHASEKPGVIGRLPYCA